MFTNHPNLSDEINSSITQSEIDGGVLLSTLAAGTRLLVRTRNTLYRIEVISGPEGRVRMSGNAKYCPQPTLSTVAGSTWGGSMLKMGFIGRGMHLEYHVDGHRGAITTSAIEGVSEDHDAISV